jgi:hypothetical protein
LSLITHPWRAGEWISGALDVSTFELFFHTDLVQKTEDERQYLLQEFVDIRVEASDSRIHTHVLVPSMLIRTIQKRD